MERNLQFQLPYSTIFQPLVRGDEATTFHSYVQALRAWSQLASDKMAEEIQQAIKWPSEIVTSTLTQGQQARSARLFALLKVAFASHVRIDSLIRAYEAGCAIAIPRQNLLVRVAMSYCVS